MSKLKRKFNHLEEGDEIFNLELSTQEIVGKRIQKVQEHKKFKDYLIISYYKIPDPADVDTKRLLDEKSEDIPTANLIVPKASSIVTTKELPPQVWAADKEQLREWMINTS